MIQQTINIRNYLLIVFLIFIGTSEAQKIDGNLQLDSTWKPVVYLSYIESMDDMFMMSADMIIAESKLDEKGNFVFNTEFFNEEDGLYRIHISKKSDSPTSIIIGGANENHFFLIANRDSRVRVSNESDSITFQNIKFEGYDPNSALTEIETISSYKDSTDYGLTTVKRDFLLSAIEDKLRFVADTSKHPLVSLYALYESDFESDFPINKGFYKNYAAKWEDEDSKYFTDFRKQINLEDSQPTSYYFIIIGVVCFLGGFFVHFLLKKRRAKVSSNPLETLSIQERKIFALIQQGKSNKEISEECNIGLSTTKTHVSNIYAKLNIKSRKEALGFKLS